ncbi:MAG: hypothetical protein MUE41_05435 [Gemmatimonadaceae bacterium]|jgi:hypothetical protein|nr:hypothetical protein [Gemmatimonadaceae bacterium]
MFRTLNAPAGRAPYPPAPAELPPPTEQPPHADPPPERIEPTPELPEDMPESPPSPERLLEDTERDRQADGDSTEGDEGVDDVRVDDAVDQSFPASDPPSTTATRAGAPTAEEH